MADDPDKPDKANSADKSGKVTAADKSGKFKSADKSAKFRAAAVEDVSDGAPVGAVDSPNTGRTQRLANAAVEKMSAGVSVLGTGLDKIGEGISKVGEVSRAVPLVGSTVTKLGDSLQQVGESMQNLPAVTATRRGRLIVRSLIVGFLLVATWIVIIVALQVKSSDAPDFRPNAEKILAEISSGPAGIDAVYNAASPRFQEVASKEKWIDEMNDLHETLGEFKEITSINDTLVTTGPTGRIGRVSLTIAYEKGITHGSVSFHEDKGQWKFLGVGVEVPSAMKITQAQREERVAACKDNLAKSCDLHEIASGILEQLRAGDADKVWDQATEIFQKQEEKGRFVAIQQEHTAILGPFIRILAVSEAKIIGGNLAAYDVVAEYQRANGVRVTFSFSRRSKSAPWKLLQMVLVMPLPRADEQSVGDLSAPGPIIAGSELRPVSEKILSQLAGGPTGVAAAYDAASPLLRETVKKEDFLAHMKDLHASLGAYKKVIAMDDPTIANLPTGRVAKVPLTISYEKGTVRGSVDLSDEGDWKLTGVTIELPEPKKK
ncbi:MAG TPA: hypothetical protein VGM90_16090 [Kofleriaceae bacterium]|jgi:hypothetical protein